MESQANYIQVVNVINIFHTQHIRQTNTPEMEKNTEKWLCTYF